MTAPGRAAQATPPAKDQGAIKVASKGIDNTQKLIAATGNLDAETARISAAQAIQGQQIDAILRKGAIRHRSGQSH